MTLRIAYLLLVLFVKGILCTMYLTIVEILLKLYWNTEFKIHTFEATNPLYKILNTFEKNKIDLWIQLIIDNWYLILSIKLVILKNK